MTAAVKGIRVNVDRGVAECPQCHVEIGRPKGQDVYMCASDCGRWIAVREVTSELQLFPYAVVKDPKLVNGRTISGETGFGPIIREVPETGKVVGYIRVVRYSRLAQADVEAGYITQAEYDSQRIARANGQRMPVDHSVANIVRGQRTFAVGI